MNPSLARVPVSPRILVICWYIIALLAWGGLIFSLPGYYRWFVETPIRQQLDSSSLILIVASGFTSLLCAVISLSLAGLIFQRKPDDRFALFVSFFLLIYGFVMAGPIEMAEYLILGHYGEISFRVQGILFSGPMIFLLFTFPNGVIIPSQMRWLLPFLILTSVFMGFLPLADILSFSSPRSLVIYGFLGILFLGGQATQVYRYIKISSAVERQQTKIVLYGIAVQFLLLAISSFIFAQLPPEAQVSATEGLPSGLMWWVSMTALPISITFAIIRSHLWDIDFVIRRTLVYGFLTAALALVYFGSVILFQYIFRLFIGHETPAAIVISTLVIAGLFNPLRLKIQSVIDRRFFRNKYDTEQALARFQQGLRAQVNLEEIEQELTNIVQTTVQPQWVTFWIRRPVKKE